MSRPGGWWSVGEASGAPRARWLGMFPRAVRLRAARARRIAVRPLELPAGPARLLALPPARLAVTLDPTVQPAREGGSVRLDGRLLRDDPPLPGVPFWARPEPDAARRPAAPGAAVPRSDDLPLWKRLAPLLQPPLELLLRLDGPLTWPSPLFDYQLDGVRLLLTRESVLLADDMGLGKTIQACAALRLLVLRSQAERCLMIVPASLLTQWRGALRAWAPELRVTMVYGPAADRIWQWQVASHVYLTSYETFREDCTQNPQSPPRRATWDVVILDEAQRIKNPEAEVSRKCKLLLRRRAWALTGTPLENSLDDLASVLEFVTPRRPGEAPRRLLPGPALEARQRTLQLRRKKADVLPQLPPKITTHVELPLAGPQRASYERAEREGIIRLHELGRDVRIEHVLELIVRLKQVCNVCPTSGRSAKLDDLAQRLATLEAEGHRALVFSQFTDARFGARAIARALESFRPLVYTGDLTRRERDEVVRQFREDPRHRVLVLSLRAGGQGLNLQDASYVFHFDRWWNPAVERQAEDRSHRLGQELPVHVYAYTCQDTIEERIVEILGHKQLLFDETVDGVSIDLGAALTGEELFGLFGLAPPTETRETP